MNHSLYQGVVDTLDQPPVCREVIRLGIAGLGLAGALMLRAVRQQPGVSVVAAADPHSRPLQAFVRDFNARGYTDIRELCQDPAVSVVYVATPHQFHAEHAVLAASHGKHVIIEKPMAMTLAECDRIIDAVQRNNVQLLVGHTHAYDPAIRAMRRIIDRGVLGRVRMITTFNYTDFMYRPRRPDELDTARGGGIIFNQVPHQIDIVRTLSPGRLSSVRAACAVLDPLRPAETAACAFWQFEGGTVATSTYSGADFFNSDEFHGWIGEGGHPCAPSHASARHRLNQNKTIPEALLRAERLSYGAFGVGLNPLEQAHPPHFGTTIVTCERGEMKTSPSGFSCYDEEGAHDIALPNRTGYEGVFSDLSDVLHAGVAPRHDAHWGRVGVEAMLALRQSAKEGREISIENQL